MVRSRTTDLISDKTVHGSDVDDTAVLRADHVLLSNRSCDSEGTEQVDVHLVVELLVGDVLGRSNSAGTCVIYEDVYAAELLDHLIDHGVDSICVSDVAAESECLHAEILGDLRAYRVDHFLAAGNSNDSTALACQCFCHLNTKTGGASGNDCNLSLEVKIVCHVFSPFKSLFSAKEYIILPLEKDFCFHSLFVQEKNVLSYKHLARRQ